MSYFNKKRFTMRQMAILLALILTGSAVNSYAFTVPNTFTSGTTISSTQVNANFTAIKNAIDPLEVSNYSIFSSLNYSSTNVGSTLTKLTTTSTTHSFTKTRTDTKIEVHINSRFGSGTFSGNSGVYYEVRIDDTIAPTYGNKGAITTTSTTDFLSIYAVFSGLSAGSHTVSIWAAAPSGTSTGVLVDPGGWGGAIIVKEVH